jgi:predicted RNA binding protein YcfA (HicA-like mRNA interferase family)
LPRNRKDVEAALEAKGFVRAEGDHHYFVYHTRDGMKTRARTKTSHSPKVRDIADNLLGPMARQCLLTKPEFLRLVDCPMDRDEYERRLRAQGEADEA